MNERLKELVDKTNDFMHTNYLNWLEAQSFYQSIWQEKFAELLIRECANRASWAQDTNEADIGGEVLKHFGVEEQEKVVSKPKCSVCGTTENVKYMGGHQPYLCDSEDCIPY
jgi:hypothetical protein